MTVHYFEAIECDEISSPANGSFDISHVIQAGDFLSALCDPGYKFPDGTFTKKMACNIDGSWNSFFPDCIGRSCPHNFEKIDIYYFSIKQNIFNDNIIPLFLLPGNLLNEFYGNFKVILHYCN